jgi:hypothetical protein
MKKPEGSRMSASKSQDRAAGDGTQDSDEPRQLEGSGQGAASALERMKAEHALRHKRQHGARTHGPGHDDDETPRR